MEEYMRFKLLGKSGLRVSELCLGAMTFGTAWEMGADKEESRRVFDTYAEAGGNFIDTANKYHEGESERMVGEFIKADREHFVLATKYTLFMRHGDPNFSGNHRKNMVQSLEASLKRLDTDYIDLYWLHAWDYLTPVEEVMRALDDMVRAGKILYVGISDTPAWIVSRANMLAELKGWSPFVALQIEYSLLERTVERELIPMARELDLAVTPWGVLGAGMLSGKYNDRKKELLEDKNHRLSEQSPKLAKEKNFEIAEEVIKVAKDIGKDPTQVALRWIIQRSDNIIPIVGARRAEQLKSNLGCLDFELSDDIVKRLDDVSKIDMGFPHSFLENDNILDIVYSGMHREIDNHRKHPVLSRAKRGV